MTNPDPVSVVELLRMVEAATGPDRILDAALARDVAGLCLHGNWHSEGPDGDRGRVCDDCGADSWGNLGKYGQRLNGSIPSYTASIDAALALVERMLPKVEWYRRRSDDEFAVLSIELAWRPNGNGDWEFAEADARGSTPLAIIAALLKALTK